MRFLVIAAVLAVSFCQPVFAQPVNCGPRLAVVERLNTKHNEFKVGEGIDYSGSIIEIFSSGKGWTALRTDTRGVSCIVSVGQNGSPWMPVPLRKKDTH